MTAAEDNSRFAGPAWGKLDTAAERRGLGKASTTAFTILGISSVVNSFLRQFSGGEDPAEYSFLPRFAAAEHVDPTTVYSLAHPLDLRS